MYKHDNEHTNSQTNEWTHESNWRTTEKKNESQPVNGEWVAEQNNERIERGKI